MYFFCAPLIKGINMIHICIINMQFYTNNICDIQHIFNKIENSVITVFNYKTPDLYKQIKSLRPDAIMITGSKSRILYKNAYKLPKKILTLNIPILGICYGYQWLVKKTHGTIDTFSDKYHIYNKKLEINTQFKVPSKVYYFAHNDYITKLNESWIPCITDGNQIWMAYEPTKKIIGIQFHPEKKKSSGLAFFRAWVKWIIDTKK